MPGRTALAGLAAAVCLAAPVLAGCASHPAEPSGPPGTVHGHVHMSGGPGPSRDATMSATVTVDRGGQRVTAQTTGDDGAYAFSLAPGTYDLGVAGTDALCDSARVTVASGSDQQADVTCSVK